jgi:hypothetical protein
MKKIRLHLLIVSVLICGVILTGCGGGNGSTKGSKLHKNEYLGNLPALNDGYKTAVASLKEDYEVKGEKITAGGTKNFEKLMKLQEERKGKEKEMKEKFQADVKAELGNLTGKAIPVTFSDKLKESDMLFYNISDVTLTGEGGGPIISVTVTAKNDFTVPSRKGYDYTVYYRLMSSNGPVHNTTGTLAPIELMREEQPFKKDFMLSKTTIPLPLARQATELATFTGIEFISQEEYKETMGI